MSEIKGALIADGNGALRGYLFIDVLEILHDEPEFWRPPAIAPRPVESSHHNSEHRETGSPRSQYHSPCQTLSER
jgi:hypothetical protein